MMCRPRCGHAQTWGTASRRACVGGNRCRRHDGHSKICKIRANWQTLRTGGRDVGNIEKNQLIARMPAVTVVSRLRPRSVFVAPGCRKGSFFLHTNLPEVLLPIILTEQSGKSLETGGAWQLVKSVALCHGRRKNDGPFPRGQWGWQDGSGAALATGQKRRGGLPRLLMTLWLCSHAIVAGGLFRPHHL